MAVKIRVLDENGNDAVCYRCGKLAVAFVNVTANCASSVPSVFKAVCGDHGAFVLAPSVPIVFAVWQAKW
jgi:hypothetical protein